MSYKVTINGRPQSCELNSIDKCRAAIAEMAAAIGMSAEAALEAISTTFRLSVWQGDSCTTFGILAIAR